MRSTTNSPGKDVNPDDGRLGKEPAVRWNRQIGPGKEFKLTLPLDQVAEGYRAIDKRRAVKILILP